MSSKKESVFKKRGFYVALYACLGVAMVTTAVVSFNNMAIQQDEMAYLEDEMMAVDLDQAQVVDYIYHDLDAELAIRRNQQQQPSPSPEEPSPAPGPQAQVPEYEVAQAEGSDEEAVQDYTVAVVEDEVEEGAGDEPLAFAYFDTSQAMQWPVFGEVVMDFSIDRLIYDRTLDQFRTNDSISIAAELGTQVLAAAEGVVDRIGHSRENGNYVVINHGNGWLTTYSQLQDGVLVSMGDVVSAGQPVGGVGSPSVFSVLLGNHIGFRVENNGATVDPRTVLAAN